jgi:hypothetical protein
MNILSGLDLLLHNVLECLAIFGEFLDPFVQLIECHLVFKQGPSELCLVIDERDLWQGFGLGGCAGRSAG